MADHFLTSALVAWSAAYLGKTHDPYQETERTPFLEKVKDFMESVAPETRIYLASELAKVRENSRFSVYPMHQVSTEPNAILQQVAETLAVNLGNIPSVADGEIDQDKKSTLNEIAQEILRQATDTKVFNATIHLIGQEVQLAHNKASAEEMAGHNPMLRKFAGYILDTFDNRAGGL